MKDTKGAEFAMRVAEETWKGQGGQQLPKSGATKLDIRAALPTSARGHPRAGPPPGYLHGGYAPPHMMGMGYSPITAPAVTPGFRQSRTAGKAPQPPLEKAPASVEKAPASQGTKRPPPGETTKTPRNRPIRIEFDVSTSRKKRKKGLSDEDVFDYFGPTVTRQPKTTALAIFSYLSDEDVYRASLVCKRWKLLAMDEEMWKFI